MSRRRGMVVIGITGGSGYIGGRLVQRYLKASASLRLVDDHSGPVDVSSPGTEVLDADFASPESLRHLSDCDVVLHLAARSGVVVCQKDPEGTRRVNVEGTRRLAASCRERGIPIAFASSFSVVGIPVQLPITEQTPARPTHEYSHQKAAGEEVIRALPGEGRPPGAVLRMSNLYGSYRSQGKLVAKGNVLNLYAARARAGGSLEVYAPGTQRRDYVHLEDVCSHWEASARYLLSARSDGVPTFCVASGESATVLDLAQRVADTWRALHPDRPRLPVEVVENPRRDVEILHPEFEVDPSWTRSQLGVRCEMNLDRGIRRVLEEVLA